MGPFAVPVQRNRRQRDDAHVHRKHLHKRAEGAHERRQNPSLQQGRLELERDREHADDDVRHRQVGDEVVGDRAHATAGADYDQDAEVAEDGYERYEAVAAGQEGDD